MSDDPDIEIERTYFDNLCSDLSGDSFQTWFEKFMKYLDSEFVPIGHEGREGDQACDGFSLSIGRFFQVYAPKSLKEDKKKVERDFTRALKKWGTRIKVWIFVHGKLKVKPTITKLVHDLAAENNLEVIPWSNVDLWKELRKLDRDDRITLLNMPPHFKDEPMQQLREIHRIVKKDESEPPTFEEEIIDLSKIIIEDFEQINNLSDDHKKEVLRYFITICDDDVVLLNSFNFAAKNFPNEFQLISTVIERLPTMSDQQVSDALGEYLCKSKDNRIPDVVFQVATNSKRDQIGTSKPFRRTYFRLLGECGTEEHLKRLQRLQKRERDDIVRRSIEDAINQLSSSFSNDMSIEIIHAVHKEFDGGFLHYISYDMHNNSERLMRIEKTAVFDELDREMKLHKEHFKTSDVSIPLKSKSRGTAFWIRHSTNKKSIAKIKLSIIETGVGIYQRYVESVQVPPGEFPLENPFSF